jgi:uncharacterized protein
MPSVQWLPWSAAAFARARAERKPVLLSIAAPWCQWCREMDRTSYADPDIVSLIDHGFIAIRVDADRRPDIGERYSLGGWPTTAFLTAGGEVVGGGTYIARDRIAAVLTQVAEAFATRADELRAPPAHTRTPSVEADVREAGEDALLTCVFSAFDATHGGFGGQPKFPLTAPIHLALNLYREAGDPRMAEVASATLDAMGWGPLHDPVDGGFFRYAKEADWQSPQCEKLLDVNAALLLAYLDAWQTLEATRYRDRAEDVLRYLQTWLADQVNGGWAGSQEADAEYYELQTSDERRAVQPPATDSVIYAASNAAAVSAAFRAAATLADDGLAQFAVRSLERVLLATYRPAGGVAHYFDGEARVRGLLDDQIATALACLDAYDASGNITYEMMAEELARYAVRTMWDEDGGGFFDRAQSDEDESIGLMGQRLKPFDGNCQAAIALGRLAATSGENDFMTMAQTTLTAVASDAERHGPQAAQYLLALRAVRVR